MVGVKGDCKINCSYHALQLLGVDRIQSVESYSSAEEGVALHSGLYTGIISHIHWVLSCNFLINFPVSTMCVH